VQGEDRVSGQPRVVQLAQDIARNLAYLPDDAAAAAIANHLRSFWDPRMRDQLKTIVELDPSSVDPLVRAAVALLP
jgi:formate dehydrogenase subunit delta